jgi:hypothetical protein
MLATLLYVREIKQIITTLAVQVFPHFTLILHVCLLFQIFQNAIEVFKEVIKIQPDHIDACSSVGQAYK